VRPLKDVRLEVENELRNQERERLQKAWIQRLRNNAFVRYY
jgi:hypothetical protein